MVQMMDNDDSVSNSNTIMIENVSSEGCSTSSPTSSDGDISRSFVNGGCNDGLQDLLKGEQNNMEIVSCHTNKLKNYRTRNYCTFVQLICGILIALIGFITIHFDLCEVILSERLKMLPGFPPYEQWITPSPIVTMRVFIFTVDNAEAFRNGTDDFLQLNEIGPIVYREHLHHHDVEFHANSTLSYSPQRRLEFLPDRNINGILNKTITVPNFVLLATASSLNDANFIKKIGFNAFKKSTEEDVFINITVYDYLWNYKSPVLQRIKAYFPFMVPSENSGVIHTMYEDTKDRYNVRIGPRFGNEDFFDMALLNGKTTVPRYFVENGDCDASIVNASEGALYNTRLTHNSVLWYWRKALCRQVPLHFEEEIQKGSLLAYKYELRGNVYDRLEDPSADCYKGLFHPLPDGLTDVSKCYYDVPLAASSPHFYGRRPAKLTDRIRGLEPNKHDHGSYIIVEPTMGVPIDQCARSQSNVVTPQFVGFSNEIQLFSNMAIPTFWIEYHQKELTFEITALIVLTIHVVPILQNVFTILSLLGGLILILRATHNCCNRPAEYSGIPANEQNTKRRSLDNKTANILIANRNLKNTKELIF